MNEPDSVFERHPDFRLNDYMDPAKAEALQMEADVLTDRLRGIRVETDLIRTRLKYDQDRLKSRGRLHDALRARRDVVLDELGRLRTPEAQARLRNPFKRRDQSSR
jgi:hypothetical protein